MSYKSFLSKLKSRRKSTKARLDLFDVDVDHNPYAIGLLPHLTEWGFESPNRVFIKLFINKLLNILLFSRFSQLYSYLLLF